MSKNGSVAPSINMLMDIINKKVNLGSKIAILYGYNAKKINFWGYFELPNPHNRKKYGKKGL